MLGRKMFQKLFEKINFISLLGMNIGGGQDADKSGEKKAIMYINKFFKSQSKITVFDVGANKGQYATLLNMVFKEKAQIYSFEPSKNTFKELNETICDFKNIEIFNFGFGNESQKIELYTNAQGSGLASLYKRRLDHFKINMDKCEVIDIKTIDDFCIEKNINQIHFLKLDVEGHEFKVLEGAKRMLKSGSIDFIQFEFGGCNIDSRTFFQDFFYLLNDQYTIFRILKNGLYPIHEYKEIYEAFLTTNYLAQKKNN